MDSSTPLRTLDEISRGFDEALQQLSFVDIHVHDMPDCCGPELALLGPDAVIDYHYLYGEVLGGLGLRPSQTDAIWAMPRKERVDFLVEKSLADGCLPVSEARLGILSAAHALGLPTASGDFRNVLREWRTLYADMGPRKYTERVFELAGITRVVSTQSPFVEAECRLYLNDAVLENWDPRYWCGLRWDEFVHKPETAAGLCQGLMKAPEAVGPLSSERTVCAARRLLEFWADRLPNVKYVALSLPGTARLADRSSRITQCLEDVIVPVASERRMPVFLMPYVRRAINPSFRNAGDCVERGEINDLIDFMSRHTETLFAVTPLDENDNYPLAFAVRALPNVRVWGHWWGNLNPSLIEAQLRLRLEMNGYVHFGVNSDARIRDQLLFKWPHYLRVMKRVVVERCHDIAELSGWPVTVDTIRRSIQRLQDHERLFNPDAAA